MSTTEWPATLCCMGDDKHCVCTDMERALRGWQSRSLATPMSPAQREACLSEIGRVEGYAVREHEHDTDRELAGNVLNAWTDYARDKGLL